MSCISSGSGEFGETTLPVVLYRMLRLVQAIPTVGCTAAGGVNVLLVGGVDNKYQAANIGEVVPEQSLRLRREKKNVFSSCQTKTPSVLPELDGQCPRLYKQPPRF